MDSDQPDRLACVIASDGFICRGFKIESCDHVETGKYDITWQVPLQGEGIKTNFACTIGAAAMETPEPGLCTVQLTEVPRTMRVLTYDLDGKLADRPFHLVAFRD